MTEVPPRGPALANRRMLFAFDVDCGQLIDGHRFIARGLADCGTLEADGVSADGISLEYELVPGIPPLDDRTSRFGYIVHVDYEADAPMPWRAADGGAIAPFEGGPSTHGSLGDWPLPSGARILRFHLSGPHRQRPGGGLERSPVAGTLEVDLEVPSVQWIPGTSAA